MVIKIGIVPEVGSAHFVYQLTLNTGNRVYMKVRSMREEGEDTYVIYVDSQRFLAYWGNNPQENRLVGGGNPEALKQDYKYHKAVEGFRKGLLNPVPLADVNCLPLQQAAVSTDEPFYIGFRNGITRTLFLIANGVDCFPVRCRGILQATLLQTLVGSDLEPDTVAGLLPPGHYDISWLQENGLYIPRTWSVDKYKLLRDQWMSSEWWETDTSSSKTECPYEYDAILMN